MKAVTGTALTLLNQETGTEPLLVLQINLGAGLRYYADRTISADEGLACEGRILEVGDFTYQKKADSFGASGNVTVTLDDYDKSLKFAYDNTALEQKPAYLFIYYPGTSFGDRVPLLLGKITGPITWSEGDLKVSFTIETDIQSEELGYSPTPDDFEDLNKDAYQVPWPMIFGKCSHIPCVKVRAKTRGFMQADARLTSEVYKIGANKKFVYATDKCNVESYISDNDGNPVTVANILFIEESENFPRNQTIKIIIDNIVFEGSFFDDNNPTQFKVKQANLPKYEDIKVIGRQAVSEFEDEYSILWIEDPKYQLTGLYCYFNPGGTQDEIVNQCVKQVGNKCYFTEKFIDPRTGSPKKMGTKDRIFAAYGTFRSGLHKDRNDQSVPRTMQILNRFASADDKNALGSWAQDHLKHIASTGHAFMEIPTNEEVRLWNKDDPDVYVASLVKLDTVDAVYAKKSIKFTDGKVRQMFAPLPKSWYKIIQGQYDIRGVTPTAIQLDTPIQDRNNEGIQWDDTLYVTGSSTIGPNIVDVIEWILENYCNILIDRFSFEEVRGLVDETPANFMINNQEEALRVAEDLAWQSRCVLLIDSGVAYLKYLPRAPLSIMAFTESDIQLKSFEEKLTSLQEIKTKLIIEWFDNFKTSPLPTKLTGTKLQQFETILRQIIPEFNRKVEGMNLYTYKQNIDQFGTLVDQRSIRIYNVEDYVQQTADFWGGRYSNVWKRVKFKTYIHAVLLQPFDCISINAAGYNSPAIVESLTYNHSSKDVTIEAWLPVKAGFNSIAQEAWPE